MKTPTSVIDFLADHAIPEEVEVIAQTLARLDANSSLGETIPFNLPELRDCYVFWTPDKKWRILFQRKKTFGFSRSKVLKISLEDYREQQ